MQHGIDAIGCKFIGPDVFNKAFIFKECLSADKYLQVSILRSLANPCNLVPQWVGKTLTTQRETGERKRFVTYELIAKHRKQPNYSALAAYFKGIRSPFPV